ncbi:hypothetical protein [Mucilaginibacter sp.]
MKYKLILLLATLNLNIFWFSVKHNLNFKTSTGHMISVSKGFILYDGRNIKKIGYPNDIIADSKSNRIIEDHGSVFLFIAMMGNPNLDRFNVFAITPFKATLVADAILSPIKDYDRDGYLEFGGSDLTEGYTNPDSMYYIPTSYYEIHNGKINPDKSLTRSKDIELNGKYIPEKKRLDKDGYCCVVIPIPKKKK